MVSNGVLSTQLKEDCNELLGDNIKYGPSQVALVVQRTRLLMQETEVRSQGGEDLEEEMATQPSILARKPHRQQSLVGHSP